MEEQSNLDLDEGTGGDVAGDQILVGNIRNAKNIAIGKEIQQTIYEGYTAAEVALLIAEARKAETPPPAAITVPPPPEPAKPPEIVGFVGRDQELTYFVDMLESAHLAVIAGMAGVGKTALAATLVGMVAREPSRIFWHSFHEGEGIDGVVWGLAGFLAWHGKDELWKLLQSAHLTGGQPPPTETLFDYLLQLVRDGNYLLCFDDFHHVDDDPTLNQLVERLRQALVAGQLSIVITSRRVPEFVTLAQVEAVQGLSNRDTERLLRAKGVTLTPDQMAQLYTLTAGNAEFLILAIDALQNARDPEALLAQLAATDDIERYLIKEVDDGLTGQERTVMNALAILLGYAATRDAIEAVVERGNVFRTLRYLAERHLLVVQETSAGRTYRQHDLVREFYYEMSSRRERKKGHTRAGEYYRDEEVDLLLAAIHYERAAETEEAARLATQDLWGIVNRGQIRPLRKLLEQFTDGQLAVAQWIEVNLAKGQLYTLQAEAGLAEASLQTALTQVNSIADEAQQRILAARACRNMGELLEERSPHEALSWLEQGLARLQGADQVEEAALYIRSGTVYYFLSRYQEALVASQRGLELLPVEPNHWRSIALRDLSGININLGNVEQVQTFAAQAVALCEQLGDRFHMTVPIMNLGIGKFIGGDVKEGLSLLNHALTLAGETGNKSVQAQIEQNLGTAKVFLGDLTEAHTHLQTSLELAHQQRNRRILLYSLRSLIDLHIELEEWQEAISYLTKAEELSHELGDQRSLMRLFGLWCEVKLAAGELNGALEYANKEIEQAIELVEPISVGIGKRDRGKILTAMAHYDEAFAMFAESLTLFDDDNLLDIALTKMEWGKALLISAENDKALQLLLEAQQEFQKLELLDEVEEINRLI